MVFVLQQKKPVTIVTGFCGERGTIQT